MKRLIRQRLGDGIAIAMARKTGHLAVDQMHAGRRDDFRFDGHRLFVIGDPATRQRRLPVEFRSVLIERMIVKRQQFGEEIGFLRIVVEA